MIVSLRGTLEWKGTDQVFISMGGVSVQVFVPSSSVETLGPAGAKVHLHTFLYFKNDVIAMYGFATPEERGLFQIFLGITGIGPKLALSLLSSLKPEQIIAAAAANNASYLGRVPGLGEKKAARLILELKSELEKGRLSIPVLQTGQPDSDITGALTALGYTLAEINQAVGSIPGTSDLTPEEKVKLALQYLSSR
ncbi:MAG: Holliday junction branch migration protein RuvA [Dehalococcoidia bacterium]|nr:Holliday junction branch migration protein RuvA [Dehalococcoidia bacterium]